MKQSRAFLLSLVLLSLLIALSAPAFAQLGGAFKVGSAPPPQEVYTKVNLTEPYNIIEGFTIYPSLVSPDLFYYVPQPRVARTDGGRLVFRLLDYAMAENRNQVGSADVAGGYLQFDIVMSPTPDEEKKIKQNLLNPPKRFSSSKLNTSRFLTLNVAKSVHPYNQVWGANAKPKLKNIRLAPIPIHNLKAKARIPGVLAGDKTDTDWFNANGDASGTTTFAINLSGPQAHALYQAIMNPSAVEPFNVYFDGELGGYIKCRAKLTVRTSEIYNFMQNQQGSSTKIEKPGKRGVSLFGVVDIGGKAASSSQTDRQINNIDVNQMLNTAIKIEGDLQGYDDALMSMAKYAVDQAMARFGTPISLDEIVDPKRELKEPNLPKGVGKPGIWAYAVGWWSKGVIQPGKNPGRKAYYGYYDQKTLNQSKSANFSVDLNKQIAVTWQFSPSSSIFDDSIVEEIQENAAMYAQKLALNDPFFEKLDITYTANLDFARGPFNKVVFHDVFKLKDGTGYSVPGLLLESKDYLNDQGKLIGAAPPQNLRFGGLLQGNLYKGDIGGEFNILNPGSRLTALRAKKWPTHSDGSKVKGITHRWKYTVFFRPSVKDPDFPPSWTSDEFTNSETVLTATIPHKVAVITVTADGLDINQVQTAITKIKYTQSGGAGNSVTKAAKLRPGGPDKNLYFFDESPKTDLPCQYQYTLVYKSGRAYTSEWMSSEGGLILLLDPNPVETTITETTTIYDDY